MDVARLNFSHGDHHTHREIIRNIRRISKEMDKEVGILQDLRGPKIRIGRLPVSERMLQADERIFLTPYDTGGSEALPIDYPFLHNRGLQRPERCG